MLAKKTSPATNTAALLEAANDWEASRTFAAAQSESRAWKITYAAIAIAILSWAGIVLMLPLKETIPYVIYVDKTTGVPDLVSVMTDKTVGYQDVMDKYWLAVFVRARETYDWNTLQKDYSEVGFLSSTPVNQEYTTLFTGDKALDKTFGNKIKATIDVLSVVPNGKGIATVQFIKTIKRLDDVTHPGEVTKWVATIGYEYLNAAHIKESVRLINPFGFQVLSYRVDPVMVTEEAK